MRERETNSKLKSAVLLCAGVLFTACTTVPVETTGPAPDPVIERPTIPVDPTPVEVDPVPTEDDPDDGPVVEVPDSAAPYFNNRDGLTLPHMAGRDTKRLALLLPFSAGSEPLRAEANAMFQAAELALFQRDQADIVLTVLDTKGTEDGARSATRAALQQGADVILGPIIAGNVRAASREARRSGTPLLAFSNDRSVADRGTYLLSFPPESEVDRIVAYAASEGVTRFAFIGPEDTYGRRVRQAYLEAVERTGGEVTVVETYQGRDIGAMQEPAIRLAQAFRSQSRTAGRDAFEAVLLPEAGTQLRSLAPLLPFNGIDPSRVMFLGTSRWDDLQVAREPALNGGVFASADKESSADFEAGFERSYGSRPTGLASLAYDAVLLGAYIADGDPDTRLERAEDPLGFFGADGYVRFARDGRPDRGLAVYRVRNGGFQVVDPAPLGPPPEG
ncbi:MAG: penicillin-binding protein activator [Litorimonas sp.]